MLGVVGHRRNVGVTDGQPCASVAGGVSYRAPLAQLVPDRIGVVQPCGVGVVEIGCPVNDRRAPTVITNSSGHGLLLDGDGVLGTVGRRQPSLVLEAGRDHAVVSLEGIAELVDSLADSLRSTNEHFRRG